MSSRRGRKSDSSSTKPAPTQSATIADPATSEPIFPRFTSRDLMMTALLIVAAVIAYLPALDGGTVWDDSAHITRPDLQSLHGLWRIWFDLGSTQQYYPLLHSAFWMEHQIWGDAVAGYHLTNLTLHLCAALLVVMILRRLELPGAWLAGFLFALHPVCVEAVAWISEQKSTLSAVFYLASALVYLGFDRTRDRSRYLLASALFVLALLSKTVTATLPPALLVVFWWKRGRADWKRDVTPLLPWFAVGAGAGLFTAWVERTYIGAQGGEFALSLIQRGLLAGRAIWFYLYKLIFPINLTFLYPHWTIDATAGWQYLFPVGVLAVTGALWLAAKRTRGPLAGFLFFAGTLFPVLGFFNIYPFRYSYVADHFQYLASLGIIVPVAVGLTLAAGRISSSNAQWATALPGVLVAVLGLLTWNQTGDYRDYETLYKATIARNPSSWMAHYNLATELMRNPQRVPEAIDHLRTAVQLKPDSSEMHNNLGLALSGLPGRLPEAIAEYQEALRIQPDSAQARTNLGAALLKLPQKSSDALSQLEEAVKLKPDSGEAQNALGLALSSMQGRLPEAVSHLEAAVRLLPDSPEAQTNLGNALMKVPGRDAEAIAHFEIAVRLKPDLAEAQGSLGYLLSNNPARLQEALGHLETAVRLKPNSSGAHSDLGIALAKVPGRMPDAVAELQEAMRLDPGSAEAHTNLGFALSSIPARMPDAIAEYEKALKINPNQVDAHTDLGMALLRMPARRQEAIQHLETALRLKPDLAPVRQVLDQIRSGR